MDPNTALPFFQSSSSDFQGAYSYGDPRGGSYPDPSAIFGRQEETEGLDEEDDQDVEVSDEMDVDETPHTRSTRRVGFGAVEYEDDEDIDPEFASDDQAAQDFPSSGEDSEIDNVYKTRRRKATSNKATPKKRQNSSKRQSTGSTTNDVLQSDGRRKKRPRKRKDPNFLQHPEFKRLNGLVTNAWLMQDHDSALGYALEAVQLYPEYFPLHATIAEILSEKGRPQDAIGALFTGVQFSRSPDNWWYTVDRIQSMEGNEKEKLEKLAWCYSKIVSFDSKDIQARLGRAGVYLEHGAYRRAKNDCEPVLAQDPVNHKAIQIYVNACIGLEEPETALSAFESYINTCTNKNSMDDATHLSWPTVLHYLDVLMQLEENEKALKELKRLSRWMLGRSGEIFWDSYSDDREWDCDSQPRRQKVSQFRKAPGREEAYGIGLPLEMRVRLGILRIMNSDDSNEDFEEGFEHLRFLLSSDLDNQNYVIENADLFKEAADCLREHGHHEEALQFYEPILKQSRVLDSRFYFDIAICYQALGRQEDVRSAINRIRQGDDDPATQIGLAKLYQSKGRLDLMWRIISQLKRRDQHHLIRKEGLPLQRPADVGEENDAVDITPLLGGNRIIMSLKHRASKSKMATTRREADLLRGFIIKTMYEDLKKLEPQKQMGDLSALDEWIRIATELYIEFSSYHRFFVSEKKKPFVGEYWTDREIRLGANDILNPNKKVEYEPLKDWRGISLDDWTDILAHYAVTLAELDKNDDCKEVLKKMGEANVIYAEPERYEIVRIASLHSSIVTNDEEWMLEECRWFCKQYKLATDGFRLPGAASRALLGTPTVFREGPEQKFWLRQIRAMDFALLTPEQQQKYDFTDSNRAKWMDNQYEIKELDPELYALYANQMSIGSSPVTALNYYLRVYAMRPNDPILHLCIALVYIAMAFKRQSSNRLQQVQHALAFMNRYYETRSKQGLKQKQEAEFNMGMLYNTLALHHLAIPAYERCMALSDAIRKDGEGTSEDLVAEAALAKRQILAINGDLEGARRLTRKYLVL